MAVYIQLLKLVLSAMTCTLYNNRCESNENNGVFVLICKLYENKIYGEKCSIPM